MKDNLIQAPSDISNIVRAVFDLAGTLNSSNICESSYIQSKVDQYIILSNAHSEELCMKKNKVMKDIKTFKRKKDFVTRDPEVDDYLTTFMKVIRSGYKTCQKLNKGLIKLTTEKGELKQLQSAESCLELVPVCGLRIRKRATKHFINEKLKEKIETNAKNAVISLGHKEVEKIVEFAVVTFLFKYKDEFR